MTHEEIIAMAREAGFFLYDLTETHGIKTVESDHQDQWAQLEHFAALVAAKEREACAQVCDGFDTGRRLTSDFKAAEMAAAIRARSPQ